MLAIEVELLHGTFRGDPDGTANTGGLTHGEWPPAPYRVFAALVAADGTGKRCRVTDGRELDWFERLPAPVIRAHRDYRCQERLPRFIVEHADSFARQKPPKKDGAGRTATVGRERRRKTPYVATHQEYVGRKSATVRPGVSVAPRDPHIVYVWDDASPSPNTVDALRRRAARIGYLGAADSPVRVRVATRLPVSAPIEDAYTPDPNGTLMMNVFAPGDLQILDRVYEAWVEHGADIARSQFPALRHLASYREPGRVEEEERGEVVAWLRIGAAIPGRRVAAVTSLFKEAVLSKYQDIHGEPPAVLHGHGFPGSGYELARFLALPDVGFEWSRGRIHGLALWLPPGFDPAMSRKVRDAAFAVRRLSGRSVDVSVTPRDQEERPVAAQPRRWERRATHWATVFPAIHERRGTLDLAAVSKWCRHAGLPAPERFRAARTPLVRGAVDLAPIEVNRPGRPGLPYSHVELWFRNPIRGPVVIGSGRQRGFGLCAPLPD